MSQIAEFERIEAIATNPSALDELWMREIRALRDSLAANIPPSTNPAFFERVRRVEAAINARLSEKQWWEKPPGIIAIAVIGTIIAAAILYLVGWN